MPTLQEYKCPCCGGAITFDSNKQKMRCPYCENEYEIDTLRSYDEAVAQGSGERVDWEKVSTEFTQKDVGTGAETGLVSYVCESCAGEIVTQPVSGSFACPYCGNQIVSQSHFSGMAQPDMVIPFKLDKKAAKEALQNHLKGKRFLPKVFASKNKIDSVQGVYVPFWLFDCEVDANMRYDATKQRMWSDSQYNYVRTDHYVVKRAGKMCFSRVPVDASVRLDDAYMDALEPFDYSAAQSFNPAFLAGYSAEKFDVSVEDSRGRADERIKKSTNEEMDKTVTSYDSVSRENTNIQLKSANIRYALLPVWLVSTRYEDKIYTFAMNGQTGKFVGDLPVDQKRFWTRFAGIFAIVTAIGSIITLFL